MKRRSTPVVATTLALLPALALTLALGGCGSDGREDPILRLSTTEALEQGKELLDAKKYARARRFLSHAFEVEPNSASGREALLLVADTYFLEGGTTNFIQAEAKYRDFLNRFPTSSQAAYAQFQTANSLAKRMEKPDRDQSATRKALEAYRDLIRLYPTTDYAAEADDQIPKVIAKLAEHEFVVGFFNYRYGNTFGAIERLNYLLDNFADYPERDRALYYLALAYQKSRRPDDAGKAEEVFDRLRREHPESTYISQIPAEKPKPESVAEESE